MAAFSIDNLLSKPKPSLINSERIPMLDTSSMCYPLSIQVAPKTDILPPLGQCQFNPNATSAIKSAKLESQSAEIIDVSSTVPDHAFLHAGEHFSSSKAGTSPRISTPGSWTDGDAALEAQLHRNGDARSPDMESGSGCLSPLQKDEFGQKNIPEPRRMLIKG